MEDQLQRQHQALTCLHDRRWLTLLGSNRPVGSFDGEVGAEGEVSPDSGFDMPGDPSPGAPACICSATTATARP